MIAERQRWVAIDRFRETFRLDVWVLDLRRTAQIVLQVGRLVRKKRLCDGAASSRQNREHDLQVRSRFDQRTIHFEGLP